MIERATLGGLEFEYDTETKTIRMAGNPAIFIWVESTLAGLISGLQRSVGTERIRLSLHGGGRDGVDQDWAYICQFPTFEQGFAELTKVAAVFGWGGWELVSLDSKAQVARVRARNHWEADCQKALGVSWGSSYLGGKFAGIFQRHFGVPQCWAEQTAFASKGDEYDEFVIRPSDASLEDRVERLLATDEATKADLAVALERVRKEVEERAETEKELREKLDLIARQEEAIRALSTPIIEVWDGVITLPLMGVIDSQRAAETMTRLLDAIVHKNARHALIDLTGVEVIDTSTADHILRLVRAAELLGAQCVITGIRPAVAQTMVSIGIDLSKLVTLASLRDGLLRCMGGARAGGARPRSVDRGV
ncbi:STAS domain-containing protein [Polyangium spumosum]|uniref:STAS domain-containing protein n=1 Tax=Polyangium spumosum TaxID=889282 RepID=A0A6N7PV34_9BACT|nr:STAS domain-containing protein [Polyangium spumosum]MRG95427.1 STAS domain-containing protein [Polyangium spumosum]